MKKLSVEEFIHNQNETVSEIMIFLHEVFTEQFELEAKIRFHIPFYYGNTWICYLNPIKDNGVELAFVRANEFYHDQMPLEFKNRKQVAGITYYSVHHIDLHKIEEVIHEAVMFDQTKPYSFRKNR